MLLKLFAQLVKPKVHKYKYGSIIWFTDKVNISCQDRKLLKCVIFIVDSATFNKKVGIWLKIDLEVFFYLILFFDFKMDWT